jgi:hypothetical protein
MIPNEPGLNSSFWLAAVTFVQKSIIDLGFSFIAKTQLCGTATLPFQLCSRALRLM